MIFLTFYNKPLTLFSDTTSAYNSKEDKGDESSPKRSRLESGLQDSTDYTNGVNVSFDPMTFAEVNDPQLAQPNIQSDLNNDSKPSSPQKCDTSSNCIQDDSQVDM